MAPDVELDDLELEKQEDEIAKQFLKILVANTSEKLPKGVLVSDYPSITDSLGKVLDETIEVACAKAEKKIHKKDIWARVDTTVSPAHDGDIIDLKTSPLITSLPIVTVDPTLPAHAATKHYVDMALTGLDWQDSIKNDTEITAPANPVLGDRYLIAGIGGDWAAFAIGDIVQWSGSAWLRFQPNKGFAVWVEATSVLKVYSGTAWVTFASTFSHGALLGLLADDHPQYVLADGSRGITGPLGISGALSAGSLDVVGAFKADAIAEHTLDAGVTIDGMLLKDSQIHGLAGLPLVLTSGQADGATAVGFILDTDVEFVDAAAKMLSIRNHHNELLSMNAYGDIDLNGGQLAVDGIFSHTPGRGVTVHSFTLGDGSLVDSCGLPQLQIVSGVVDSATAIGFKLNTINPLNTLGSRVLSLQSAGVELFDIRKGTDLYKQANRTLHEFHSQSGYLGLSLSFQEYQNAAYNAYLLSSAPRLTAESRNDWSLASNYRYSRLTMMADSGSTPQSILEAGYGSYYANHQSAMNPTGTGSLTWNLVGASGSSYVQLYNTDMSAAGVNNCRFMVKISGSYHANLAVTALGEIVGGTDGTNLTYDNWKFKSAARDFAGAVAYQFGTSYNLTTAGAKLLSFQNFGAEKFAIDKNGGVSFAMMADSVAAVGTLYYSTTAGKLVFKDPAGVVNPLY